MSLVRRAASLEASADQSTGSESGNRDSPFREESPTGASIGSNATMGSLWEL